MDLESLSFLIIMLHLGLAFLLVWIYEMVIITIRKKRWKK